MHLYSEFIYNAVNSQYNIGRCKLNTIILYKSFGLAIISDIILVKQLVAYLISLCSLGQSAVDNDDSF